jgi:hypothetical protein
MYSLVWFNYGKGHAVKAVKHYSGHFVMIGQFRAYAHLTFHYSMNIWDHVHVALFASRDKSVRI